MARGGVSGVLMSLGQHLRRPRSIPDRACLAQQPVVVKHCKDKCCPNVPLPFECEAQMLV
jgi:hypothetical protein